MIRARLDRLREIMKREGIDLYYIPSSDFHNSEYIGDFFKCRQYMSGFTGSAGSLIITKEEACLFTDGRYHIQAEKELKESGIHLFKCGEPYIPSDVEYAKVYMKKHKTIGFDGRVVSAAFVERFLKEADMPEGNVIYEKDLVNELWTERPEKPENKIYKLEDWQTGEISESKLKRIRKAMSEEKAEVHIISSLDDIAWIFNLRGSDVANNPVFLSYAVITQQEAYLYTGTKAITKEIKDYLRKINVQWKLYDEIYQDLMAVCKDNRVLLDKNTINYSLCRCIPKETVVINKMNPSAKMKAIKNSVEIENTKKAHIKDGLAVTRFIHYMKENTEGEMTEYQAAEYLDSLRKNTEGCFDLSFETISAYGSNAAMMHYSADKDNSAMLKKEGFLLVDSGGQYKEGTTDVTRTIALGPLTKEMKKHYTLTLVAMLRLMNAKFLKGCTGRNLDILARGVLWEHGLDYRCGTGHGVGHILNVHEGPNSIRWRQIKEVDECELEPGMITTDEPGVYLENEYGIRIENELLCVKDTENQWGEFLKFECLTFVPIELEAVDVSYMEKKDIEMLNEYQKIVYDKLSEYMTEEEKVWLRKYTGLLNY